MLTSQNRSYLYGQDSNGFMPLVVNDDHQQLHPDVLEPFHSLRNQASAIGVDLQVASGFRGFDRQLSIWNRKASGQLPVLGSDGQPIDMSVLSETEQVFAILRWSALPGASRHHWGTDMDVFDASKISSGYQLQLTIDESRALFSCLHHWLDTQIERNAAEGFFRPYCLDRGGLAPEPWHLSYAPLAQDFQQAFSLNRLAQILAETDIALREAILANLDEIYERFIEVPYSIYPAKRV